MAAVDPRAPCLIGVGQQTWHPDEVGEEGAPEPLAMWEDVARLAADDTGVAGSAVLDRVDGLQIVYCQTWQYDDPTARLAARLGVEPRHTYYSGIGGTTPQVLVDGVAEQVLAGELDVALVCGAEALATQRRDKRRGDHYPYSFKPEERRPFPWEAPFHPTEVAHEVFQAWLTFAIFDNARRGHLGVGLDEYRRQLGDLLAPFTDIAHLDVYSCFGSSVNFARDALALRDGDSRSLTVTGGLPYHGGAGSDYMTHSIATMADVLRRDPGSYGLVSGVGMHMTKHVYGLYSSEPGPVAPPEQGLVQAVVDAGGKRDIRNVYDGAATVAAYSVVHGRDGEPEWGVVICDVPEGDRAYGKVLDADMLASIERDELVGRKVTLTPTAAETAAGKQQINVATL